MSDVESVESMVKNYTAVYGYKVENVIATVFKEMAEAGDGNAMFLLQGQLVEAVRIIREKIGAVDMVLLSDEDEKKRMN